MSWANEPDKESNTGLAHADPELRCKRHDVRPVSVPLAVGLMTPCSSATIGDHSRRSVGRIAVTAGPIEAVRSRIEVREYRWKKIGMKTSAGLPP